MTLLLRLVAEFVAEAALWLGLQAVIAAAVVAVAGAIPSPEPRPGWGALVLSAFAGAMVGAAVAHRFGLPEAWTVGVWRRPLPVLWSVLGSATGAALVLVRPLVSAGRSSGGNPLPRRGVE